MVVFNSRFVLLTYKSNNIIYSVQSNTYTELTILYKRHNYLNYKTPFANGLRVSEFYLQIKKFSLTNSKLKDKTREARTNGLIWALTTAPPHRKKTISTPLIPVM